MMPTNENTWIRRQEAYFKKLTKSHEDILKIENFTKRKKLEKNIFCKINFIKEKFLKLFVLFFTFFLTIFAYYFYIYVN
jgi:hypothetical protein